MGESTDQIRRHIEILSEFEKKYREFLTVVHNEWAGGQKTWTVSEFAARKREIQMLATRADLAMKASGVGQLYITFPPAMGGGIKSADLPSQVFDFDTGFVDDGLGIQWKILDRIPSQIAGLEIQLEEAEAAETRKRQKRKRTRAKLRWRFSLGRLGWVNHPWTITVGGGIVAAVVAAAIIALAN